MRTSEVVRRELREDGRWSAELTAETALVAAGITGRVEAVHVRIGTTLEAGEPIATLAIPGLGAEILAAKAAVTSGRGAEGRAAAELRAARREFRRVEGLVERRVSSARELDDARTRLELAVADLKVAEGATETALAELERAEARAAEVVVVAPFDGTVSASLAEVGAWVVAGQPVARVVSSGDMWVRFEVPENDLASFVVGTEVVVSVPSVDGPSGRATVTGVAAEVMRERRTAWVEAKLAAHEPHWKPGMFAEVVAPRRQVNDAVVVPAAAVLTRLAAADGGVLEAGVLVVETDDAGTFARWVPVEIAARAVDAVAIDSSVAGQLVGAQVIIAGHTELPDGARISVVADGGGSASR